MGNSRSKSKATQRPVLTLDEMLDIPPSMSVNDFGSVTFQQPTKPEALLESQVHLYFTIDLVRDDYLELIRRALTAQSRRVERKSHASLRTIQLVIDLTNEEEKNRNAVIALAITQLLENIEMAAKKMVRLHRSLNDKAPVPTRGNAEDKEWRYQIRGKAFH